MNGQSEDNTGAETRQQHEHSRSRKTTITVSAPYPRLDPGNYVATCTEATVAWANQWRKWMCRLVLEPMGYEGAVYSGKLCKFLSLGTDRKGPHAGPNSHFRKLWVELNGDQPTATEVTLQDFVGRLYQITVVTVITDRKGQPRSPADCYSIVREIRPYRRTQ